MFSAPSEHDEIRWRPRRSLRFTAPDSSELGYVSQIEHVQPCPPCCALAVRARRNVLRCSISDILSELWCVTNHRCQGALSRPSYGWRDHAFRIRGNRAGMIAGSAGRRPPAGWLAGRGVGAVRAPSAHACVTGTGWVAASPFSFQKILRATLTYNI